MRSLFLIVTVAVAALCTQSRSSKTISILEEDRGCCSVSGEAYEHTPVEPTFFESVDSVFRLSLVDTTFCNIYDLANCIDQHARRTVGDKSKYTYNSVEYINTTYSRTRNPGSMCLLVDSIYSSIGVTEYQQRICTGKYRANNEL